MSQTATAVRSALTWFEIPVLDFDRAVRFYETILDSPLRVEPFGNSRIAMFPYEQPGIGGCLDEGSFSRPCGSGGTVVYLDVSGRLDSTLMRVEDAGGRILANKTALPPGMGWFAQIADSEGNRIGLHAIS